MPNARLPVVARARKALRLYTVTDVAQICGVSRNTVYNAIARRELYASRLGPRTLRISETALRQWLEGAARVAESVAEL